MSRKRDPQWAWLPKRVYFSKGRFIYVSQYKPKKELYLAPGSASQVEVLNEYVKIQKGLEGNPRDTLQALQDTYARHAGTLHSFIEASNTVGNAKA